MRLFEALALRKALQNQLAQLVSLRNSTFEYPEDERPGFDFEELTKRIKEKANEVTRLKLAIMNANMNSKLPNGLTLYEGIIKLANIRPGRVVGQHKGFKEKPISPADCSITRVETQ